MGAGNLMVAAAILFCGLTFTGISTLAKLLNLAMFSESSFMDYRRNIYFLLYTLIMLCSKMPYWNF